MSWTERERRGAVALIAGRISMSMLRRKSNNALCWIIAILVLVAVAGYQMGKSTKALKDMGSMYVMIDNEGVPIDFVPLHLRYPSQSDSFDFVERCMTMMFDVDALSYREQTLRFLNECMTIRDGVQFVYAFREAGFFDLISAGATLQMDVTNVALANEYILEGVLHMRFDIEGLVYVMRGRSITTPLEISVIVKRQNVDQYKSGITISQVIW